MTDVITNALRQFVTTSTRLTVSSLRPYTTYQCTVAAFTVAQGPLSAIIVVQTYQDGTYMPAILRVENVAMHLKVATSDLEGTDLSELAEISHCDV